MFGQRLCTLDRAQNHACRARYQLRMHTRAGTLAYRWSSVTRYHTVKLQIGSLSCALHGAHVASLTIFSGRYTIVEPTVQFDDTLLRAFMRGFYGYGTYRGRYWFVGKEEGSAFAEAERRLRIWSERGRCEFEALSDYHRSDFCVDISRIDK